MSSCCNNAAGRKKSTSVRTVRAILEWVVPSLALIVVPKCPACMAAHVALWTGLGLSLSAASYVRGVTLLLCIAALLAVTVKLLGRSRAIYRPFK